MEISTRTTNVMMTYKHILYVGNKYIMVCFVTNYVCDRFMKKDFILLNRIVMTFYYVNKIGINYKILGMLVNKNRSKILNQVFIFSYVSCG